MRETIVLAPLDPVIVELCCGTAAIATVLTKALRGAEFYVADIDPNAVRNADRNLGPLGGHIYEGDLYDALPKRLQGRVDVLIANAPYVPSAELALMPPEAREHEPRIALDGGGDGLDLHVRIAARAESWLAPGGHLLIETSRRQATRTAELVAQGGLVPRIIHDSRLDATVVIGSLGSGRLSRRGRRRRADRAGRSRPQRRTRSRAGAARADIGEVPESRPTTAPVPSSASADEAGRDDDGRRARPRRRCTAAPG